MRLNCPICGERDRREFYYRGAALARPGAEASDLDWQDYMHLRENAAGPVEEFWSHDAGCGSWVKVRRDTVTHDILATSLAGESE